MRVLVVEDHPPMRMALQHGLAAEGFDVVSVDSATAAYDRVADLRPHVTLLDWILRCGDPGPVACRRLRELHPDGEVVMLTGLDDPRDQRAAFEAGATAFLQKGVSLERVARALRAAAGVQQPTPARSSSDVPPNA
jgi:DNA-binding NarL/FixJ family response regulator